MQESQSDQTPDLVDLHLIMLLHDGRIVCTRSFNRYNVVPAWYTSMYKAGIHHANIKQYVKAHVKAQFGYDIAENDILSFMSTYTDTTKIKTLVYKLILSNTVHFKVSSTREVKALHIAELFTEHSRNKNAFVEIGIDIINIADSIGELYEQ